MRLILLATLLLVIAATLPEITKGTITKRDATVPPVKSDVAPEELPQPEAFRREYFEDHRPSYNSRDAYEVLRRRNSDKYIGGKGDDYDSYLHDKKEEERYKQFLMSKLRESKEGYPLTEEKDLYGSPSEYGNDIDRAGYGLTCTTGYINASAVALLAFLFLLNIIQDVLTQITGGTGRKKREDNPILDFVGDGGIDALKEGLPEILLPLMLELSDSPHPQCIGHPLCKANKDLATRFGESGRVIGSLVSNIAAKAYSGARGDYFDAALAAAARGRSGFCEKLSPACRSVTNNDRKLTDNEL